MALSTGDRVGPYEITGETGDERLLLDRFEMVDTGAAQFTVAVNGTLAYVAGTLNPVEHDLVWVDRDGAVVETVFEGGRRLRDPRLSPDGSQVALASLTGPNLDVFVLDVRRRDLTPWTSDPGEDATPIWHPEGGLALFTEVGGGDNVGPALGWMASSNQTPEILLERGSSGDLEFPSSWSPDGRWLAFTATSASGNSDTYLLNRETREAEPFIATTGFRELAPMFSPDGGWIAYVSDQTGEEDVWIAPFPGAETPIKVSTAGGTEPLWSHDGSELFYRDSNRMMSVTFSDGPGRPDPPRPLFVDTFERRWTLETPPAYDVSPDGERFLKVRRSNPVTPTRIRVVLNWPAVFGIDED